MNYKELILRRFVDYQAAMVNRGDDYDATVGNLIDEIQQLIMASKHGDLSQATYGWLALDLGNGTILVYNTQVWFPLEPVKL